MAHRGYAVVEEPGRRIIAEEREGSGHALPWVNLAAFAERAVELSLEDRARAKDLRGPVFFDRGLIDAAAALEFATGRPVLQKFAPERFNRRDRKSGGEGKRVSDRVDLGGRGTIKKKKKKITKR